MRTKVCYNCGLEFQITYPLKDYMYKFNDLQDHRQYCCGYNCWIKSQDKIKEERRKIKHESSSESKNI